MTQENINKEIPTLTYKQLAQNYNKEVNKKKDGKKVKVKTTIRRIIRSMNKEKVQIKVVNKPGSIIKDEQGNRFMITKKGKSFPL